MAAEFRLTLDLIMEKGGVKALVGELRAKEESCRGEVNKLYRNDPELH